MSKDPLVISKTTLYRAFAYWTNDQILRHWHLPANHNWVQTLGINLLMTRLITDFDLPVPEFTEFSMSEEMELSLLSSRVVDALREGRPIHITED